MDIAAPSAPPAASSVQSPSPEKSFLAMAEAFAMEASIDRPARLAADYLRQRDKEVIQQLRQEVELLKSRIQSMAEHGSDEP